MAVGQAATSVVDPQWRRGATQAHSATHLIHAALRQVLGPQAHQAGSYNKAGYMRLDFNWNQALSAADPQRDRGDREQRHPGQPRGGDPDHAAGRGARRSARWHCSARSTAQPCASSTSGVPGRANSAPAPTWPAVPKSGVINLDQRVLGRLEQPADRVPRRHRGVPRPGHRAGDRRAAHPTLKTPREQLPEKIAELMASLKAAEKRVAEFESAALRERVPSLVDSAVRVGGISLVSQDLGELRSADELRTLVTAVRGKLGSAPVVVALAAKVGERPAVIVGVNPAARELGVKAGNLAKLAAGVLGGGGGGRDDLAQGGGNDLTRRRRGARGGRFRPAEVTVRLGTRLGIDVGKVRIGVARSDPHGILATPVATVARGEGDLAEIVRLAAEFEVVEIVVGSPLALSGRANGVHRGRTGLRRAAWRRPSRSRSGSSTSACRRYPPIGRCGRPDGRCAPHGQSSTRLRPL